MTIVWSPLHSQNRGHLEGLYNQCFPVPAGHSFFEDFPIWNPSLEVSDRVQLGGWMDNELVVSASLKKMEMKVPQEQRTLNVALLGGVTTHPKHRGHGYGSEAIQKLLEISDGSKNDLVVLWGSEEKLYSKFGFEYGGHQLRFLLENIKKEQKTPENKSFFEVRTGYQPELFEFRQNHKKGGIEFKVPDQIWFSKHVNVEWFTIWDGDGKLKAYAAVGRGIDLPNWVHDWGGESLPLKILLLKLNEIRPGLEMIFHLEHKKTYSFLPDAEVCVLDPLAMFRWLNPSNRSYEKSLWFWGLESA